MLICGSYSLVPRHDGHRLGFDNLSSSNVKPHARQRAGRTVICAPLALADRRACRRFSSSSSRRSDSSRASDEIDLGSWLSSRNKSCLSVEETLGIARPR
jgi:hypothetical protein